MKLWGISLSALTIGLSKFAKEVFNLSDDAVSYVTGALTFASVMLVGYSDMLVNMWPELARFGPTFLGALGAALAVMGFMKPAINTYRSARASVSALASRQ